MTDNTHTDPLEGTMYASAIIATTPGFAVSDIVRAARLVDRAAGNVAMVRDLLERAPDRASRVLILGRCTMENLPTIADELHVSYADTLSRAALVREILAAL